MCLTPGGKEASLPLRPPYGILFRSPPCPADFRRRHQAVPCRIYAAALRMTACSLNHQRRSKNSSFRPALSQSCWISPRP